MGKEKENAVPAQGADGAQNKRYHSNEFVNNFCAVYAASHGGNPPEPDRTVGNNGYVIGQEFTLTGEITFEDKEINNVKQTYLILTTEEGTNLSLMSIMGVSSLKGYNLKDELTVEYNVKKGNNVVKQTRTTKSDLLWDTDDGGQSIVGEFDFKQVYQPATRSLLDFAAYVAENTARFKGKKITYLGTACRPYTAKKDGTQNGESYKTGYARVMETKLWSIED